MKLKYSQEVIDKAFLLKDQGKTNRDISESLFGVRSAASSVHRILKYGKERVKDVVTPKKKPRILIFDIETKPMLAYFWHMYQKIVNLELLEEDWMVLTWSAKWLGEDEVMYDSVAFHNYKGGYDEEAEKPVVEGLWKLFDEADVVVAHNGDKFDKPKMNTRFLLHGLGQPSPYKTVDTLKIVKREFAFTSNKLAYITKFLGQVGKMDNEGFPLWRKFINGDKEAQETMLEYNIQDSTELEGVYLSVCGWDSKAPNLALYYNDTDCRCNKCGSNHLHEVKHKYAYTNLSKFPIYQCDDCGGYVRGRVNQNGKEKMKSLNMNIG